MTQQETGARRDQAHQWASYLGLMDILPGDRLLDVRCGEGGMALLAAPFVGTRGLVVGLDGGDAIASAVRRVGAHRVGDIVRFVAGDTGRLPFSDASFDA